MFTQDLGTGVSLGVAVAGRSIRTCDIGPALRSAGKELVSYYFVNRGNEPVRVLVYHGNVSVLDSQPDCGLATATALYLVPGREVMLDCFFEIGQKGPNIVAPAQLLRVVLLGSGSVNEGGKMITPRFDMQTGFGNHHRDDWLWGEDTGRGKISIADLDIEF